MKRTARVEAVPDGRWDAPSPCAGWSAREVVAHVIDTQREMAERIGVTLPEGPSVENDPVTAWRTLRDGMQAALDDPDVAGHEFDGYFGRTDFASTIDTFYCFDLVVHGWDLARATGTDETIPDADVVWVENVVQGLGDNIRMEGICGPAVEVPDSADRQTKLLAYLGRTV